MVRRDHHGALVAGRGVALDAKGHAADAHELGGPPLHAPAALEGIRAREDEAKDQRPVQGVKEEAKPAQAAARAARGPVNA
jgi:hypothetical protein